MKKVTKKIIKWLSSIRLLAFPKKIITEAVYDAIARDNGVVLFYADPERAKVFDLIRRIRKETEILLSDNEAYQIYMAVRNTAKIDGDIAEVGVYKGGSAKLICEAKEDKSLHLFDTFEGLPDLGELDDPKQFHKGEYSATFEDIKNSFKKYKNVHFYKGLFPSTAGPVTNKKFSFINLDVDIYESTLNCIKFFYPRMNKGGIIISHNYIDAPGVKKAFDDFFQNKPEPIVELSGTQCLVVKI